MARLPAPPLSSGNVNLEADTGLIQGHGNFLEMRSRGGETVTIYQSRMRRHGCEFHLSIYIIYLTGKRSELTCIQSTILLS